MSIEFGWPGVSAISITVVDLNLSWGNSDQKPDGNNDDGDSDRDEDSSSVESDIWGKSPEAKRWEEVDRPYHPGERRR